MKICMIFWVCLVSSLILAACGPRLVPRISHDGKVDLLFVRVGWLWLVDTWVFLFVRVFTVCVCDAVLAFLAC